MKAIIVDDVKLIRVELKAMLAQYPIIEIIGEANNGKKAKELIEELNPDIVFLDIHLPLLTGFQLLDSLEPEFQVVFISSFDKYIPEAQKYKFTDFLMKPIRKEKLDSAVKKIVDSFMAKSEITI